MVSELALPPSDRTLRPWHFTAAAYMLASPAADATGGRHIRSLGAAELKRLGLRPPARWADTGPSSELDRG